MNTLLRFLPLSIAAALAIGTWWLADQQRRLYDAPRIGSTDGPDFIVDHPRMTRLGPDGRAQTLVTADRLLHYTADDRSTLDRPRMLQTRAGTPPVTITSTTGESMRQIEEVHLRGDVRMTRAGTVDAPPLHLRTEHLVVLPDSDRAYSDVEVTIVQGSSMLKGLGMDFNNALRTLTVRSGVQASFVPARREPS